MTVDEEKQKQAEIAKDDTKCNHIGYFVGFGFQVIPTSQGQFVAVHGIVCMMCGAIFNPVTTLKGIGAMPPGLNLEIPNMKKSPFTKS